jgi:transposase
MGQTLKRNYDRYTLVFKLQAVKLTNHHGVMAKFTVPLQLAFFYFG